MKHLLEIIGPNATSEKAAALMEAPLSLRVAADDKHLITLNFAEILTVGSVNNTGLEALFAHKLNQYCGIGGRSIDRVAAIRNGNLRQTLGTKSNVSCIRALLPKGGDSDRLLTWAFSDKDGNDLATGMISDSSDFSYFYAESFYEPSEITKGMITAACIYRYLQAVHHVTPDDKLKKKIDSVLG